MLNQTGVESIHLTCSWFAVLKKNKGEGGKGEKKKEKKTTTTYISRHLKREKKRIKGYILIHFCTKILTVE